MPSLEALQVFGTNLRNNVITVSNSVNINYVAAATILIIVVLSYLIPDISQKLHAHRELSAMKKVLLKLSKDVNNAEKECLSATDDICSLTNSFINNSTETPETHLVVARRLQNCSRNPVRRLATVRSEPVLYENKENFIHKILFPRYNLSNKEVTIMSYLYTDSFDAIKSENENENDKESSSSK